MNEKKRISGFTIVMTILILIFGTLVIFMPTSSQKEAPPAPAIYKKGDKVLIKDCYGWVEATVVYADGQQVFVKGRISEGNCFGMPSRYDATVETTQDRLKKL